MFLKIAAQTFAAGDSLNIFLRCLGFWGSFSYNIFSYKKACMLIRSKINVSKGLQITNFKLWDEWLYLLISAHKWWDQWLYLLISAHKTKNKFEQKASYNRILRFARPCLLIQITTDRYLGINRFLGHKKY